MRQFLISVLVQLLLLSFSKPSTFFLANILKRVTHLRYTRVDVVQHKSKYQEEMKSDQRL